MTREAMESQPRRRVERRQKLEVKENYWSGYQRLRIRTSEKKIISNTCCRENITGEERHMKVTQLEGQISKEELNTVEAKLSSSNFKVILYFVCVGPHV